MPHDPRIFVGSVSVRIGARRVRLELSPAELYGGPSGMFRVRAGRRWLDAPGGGALFVDRALLAGVIADIALGVSVALAEMPDLPRNSRVTVKFWGKDDLPHWEGVRTATPPIRGHDGRWFVGVMTYAAGFIFAPVDDLTLHALHCTHGESHEPSCGYERENRHRA